MGEECGAPCPYCQSPPFQDPLGRCCREVYGQPHILDHKCQACGWEWPCRDGRARQRKEWCWEALGNLLITLFIGFWCAGMFVWAKYGWVAGVAVMALGPLCWVANRYLAVRGYIIEPEPTPSTPLGDSGSRRPQSAGAARWQRTQDIGAIKDAQERHETYIHNNPPDKRPGRPPDR